MNLSNSPLRLNISSLGINDLNASTIAIRSDSLKLDGIEDMGREDARAFNAPTTKGLTNSCVEFIALAKFSLFDTASQQLEGSKMYLPDHQIVYEL